MNQKDQDRTYRENELYEILKGGTNRRERVNRMVLHYLELDESLYMGWTIDQNGWRESYLTDALLDDMVTAFIQFAESCEDDKALEDATDKFIDALDAWQKERTRTRA